MAYGIGSVIGDIDQKVDTYRNNPEALAQMYQQNQQLIDLLALQKLKTEKEAAMRDMQMKMQTPAASIKDQREQEVMGMMRNEVAQQMGPGLQAAGQQAAQAAAPQGGGLQSLPAPNMQSMGMAEGGIVAFAGERGSYVSQEAPELEKWRAEHKTRGEAARAKSLQGLQALAEMLGIRPTAEVNKELADAIAQRKAGISDFDNEVNVAAMLGENDTANEANVAAMLGENDTANEANVAEMLGENIRRTPPQAGISTVVPQTAPTQAATPEISDPVNEANVAEMLGENIRPTTTQAAPQEQPQYRSRYEDQLAALETEGQDKMGALIDFLQGAGGKTSFAATMAGGGSRLRERDARLKQEKADVLKSLIADEQNQQIMGFRNRELAQQADLAALLREQQERMAKEELTSRKNLTQAEIDARRELAKAELTSRENLTQDEIDARRELAQIQADEAVKRAIAAAGADLSETQRKWYADAKTAMANDIVFQDILATLRKQYKDDPTAMVSAMQSASDEFVDDYLAGAGAGASFNLTEAAPTDQ